MEKSSQTPDHHNPRQPCSSDQCAHPKWYAPYAAHSRCLNHPLVLCHDSMETSPDHLSSPNGKARRSCVFRFMAKFSSLSRSVWTIAWRDLTFIEFLTLCQVTALSDELWVLMIPEFCGLDPTWYWLSDNMSSGCTFMPPRSFSPNHNYELWPWIHSVAK